jgi:hypothetical protein
MNTDTLPTQAGPVYHCFNCGAEGATFIACFRPCGSALDPWSKHIWYLKLPCGCISASRVVRLGDCIAPLPVSGPEGLTPADIPTIRASLRAIARAIPPGRRHLDPTTRIVYGLLAGTVAPCDAIAELLTMGRERLSETALSPLPGSLQADPPGEAESIVFLPPTARLEARLTARLEAGLTARSEAGPAAQMGAQP